MPKVRDWADWDEVEDKVNEDLVKEKIKHKPKVHDNTEWKKIKKTIEKKGYDKHWKNKRREGHQINKKHPNRR